MNYVQSSNVESIGFDQEASELHVRFRSSPTIYVYQSVPQDLYDRLMAAPSKGTFINREIKSVYPVYTI